MSKTKKSKNKSKFIVPEDKIVTITQAAELNDVTRQAIYVAIKLKKLKANKDKTRWTIHLDDLEAYRKQKYSRSKSMFDGELVYDPNKGLHSVNQVADMLRVPAQQIYYATRIGRLRAQRKGAAWVIHSDDIKEYAGQFLQRKKRKAS